MNILRILFLLCMIFFKPFNWFTGMLIMMSPAIINGTYWFAKNNNYWLNDNYMFYWFGQLLFALGYIASSMISMHYKLKDNIVYHYATSPIRLVSDLVANTNEKINNYIQKKSKEFTINVLCSLSDAFKENPEHLERILKMMKKPNQTNQPNQPQPDNIFMNPAFIQSMIPSSETIKQMFESQNQLQQNQTQSKNIFEDKSPQDQSPQTQPDFEQMAKTLKLLENMSMIQGNQQIKYPIPLKSNNLSLELQPSSNVLSDTVVLKLLQEILDMNKSTESKISEKQLSDEELKTHFDKSNELIAKHLASLLKKPKADTNELETKLDGLRNRKKNRKTHNILNSIKKEDVDL